MGTGETEILPRSGGPGKRGGGGLGIQVEPPALRGQTGGFPMIALRESIHDEFVERVRQIFSPDGLLAQARNFEYRREQQEMAVAVARALAEERHLVVEAASHRGQRLTACCLNSHFLE